MRAEKRYIVKKIKQGRGYKYTLRCNCCGKNFDLMGKRYNRGEGYYCSVSCANKGELRGWKGGRRKIKHGYIGIKTDDDRADSQGYYPEHRLVMEDYIGRKLTKEELVHHKNCIRDDNRIENLQIVSAAEHCNIHNPKTGAEVKCANCNKLIYKNLYLIKKFDNLYCSRNCYLEHRWGTNKSNSLDSESLGESLPAQ